MMRALRLNIRQAFCNRVSLIIMFSGLALISIYHYYYVIRYSGDTANGAIATAFKWIGFRNNEMEIYLLLMPVIASLPFSTSYNSDKSDGFKTFISKEISYSRIPLQSISLHFSAGISLYFTVHSFFITLQINNSKWRSNRRY